MAFAVSTSTGADVDRELDAVEYIGAENDRKHQECDHGQHTATNC